MDKEDFIIPLALLVLLAVGMAIGYSIADDVPQPPMFTPEQCFTAPTGQRHVAADEVTNSAGDVQGLVPKITGVEWVLRCEKSEWRAP